MQPHADDRERQADREGNCSVPRIIGSNRRFARRRRREHTNANRGGLACRLELRLALDGDTPCLLQLLELCAHTLELDKSHGKRLALDLERIGLLPNLLGCALRPDQLLLRLAQSGLLAALLLLFDLLLDAAQIRLQCLVLRVQGKVPLREGLLGISDLFAQVDRTHFQVRDRRFVGRSNDAATLFEAVLHSLEARFRLDFAISCLIEGGVQSPETSSARVFIAFIDVMPCR